MGQWVPYLSSRLQGCATTIFDEMSALAVATGSINLGQGFPDTDGPHEIAEAARAAIGAGKNQYPPGRGIPELRSAIADHQRRCYDLEFDPDCQVLVTMGATEGIAATLLALCEPGDEVVLFEPFYDSYSACIAMAGAIPKMVTLAAPSWDFDEASLSAAVTERTRLVLLNTPHNPTGKVFSADELGLIARTCVEHDLLAVTDEVYEHLVYEGRHHPLATLPGMAERTVTISSAAKTFGFTGWKVGWVCASEPLTDAVRAVKQFLTFAGATPFQYAIAGALADGPARYESTAAGLRDRRDQFCRGLEEIGFSVISPAATYFVTTDISKLTDESAEQFCRALPARCGVVAVPSSAFYAHPDSGRALVRWAFCKRPEVLAEALNRLEGLGGCSDPVTGR